jgi:hypothetical protein
MTTRPTGMTTTEIEALLTEVQRGTVAARTAITLLVVNGEERTHAARLVFHALGGSEQTELDSAGRLRYVGSGKLVAAIERELEEHS